MASRMKCYFEIEFGGRSAGRVEFELFSDVLPRTCENFKCLCTGERGGRLSYASSSFHRVIRNFMIQGGDFTRGDGTGGESIYGSKFADEGFNFRHDQPYLLSMANAGPNTNGSQFFVTLRETPHLDGRHVVFGKCISGMEIMDAVAKVAVDGSDRPLVMVTIAACGVVESPEQQKAASASSSTVKAAPAVAAVAPIEEEEEEEEEEDDEAALEGKSVMERRLLKLRMAMNKGRKANAVASKEEQKRKQDPRHASKLKAGERAEANKAWREDLANRGVDEDKAYLLETAETAGRRQAKLQEKDKRKAAFGWDVFNTDSLQRAYDRRLDALPGGEEAQIEISPLEYGTAPPPSDAALARLAGELGEREKAKQKFSRRRPDVPGADVDFINDRNKVFNKKIKRAFDKYTVELRQNLERGTAI